jgi:hypothetical protein
MKNCKQLLPMAVVLVFAILATSCGDSDPDKKQSAEAQTESAKGNSFSVGGVNSAKNDAPTDDTEAVVGKGKNYLLTQVGSRLKQLGPFKSRVENTVGLDEAERKTLISELNEEMGAFVELKPEISNSATKEDVKAVAEQMKALWLKNRQTVERAEKLLLAAKENQLITDADVASSGLQKRIDVLKASGKDTKEFEELLSTYNKKIASAKQGLESAQAKHDAAASAKSDEEKNKLLKEQELLSKSAHEDVKDAYKLLADEAHKEFSERYKK